MDIIRKIQYLLFCLLAIGFVACDDDDTTRLIIADINS